jgi:hypothetical protein
MFRLTWLFELCCHSHGDDGRTCSPALFVAKASTIEEASPGVVVLQEAGMVCVAA